VLSKIKPKLLLIALGIIDLALLILFLVSEYRIQIKHQPLGNTIQVINGPYTPHPSKRVYGYLPYWMLDNAKYLQYDKLTDLAYFGLFVDSKGEFVTRDEDGNTHPAMNAWNNSAQLKGSIQQAKNSGVRVSLTVIMQKDDDIDAFLLCQTCWTTLSDNVIEQLREKELKSISLDFEHATETSPRITNLYTDFVEYMKSELNKNFYDSSLIVATFADSFKRQRITDPERLAQVSDGLFVMTYDFHQFGSENAGPVAPLNGAPKLYEYDVTTAVSDFKARVSKFKIILGVPYYGYNFLIEESNPLASRVPGDDAIGYTVAQYYAQILDSDSIPLKNSLWLEEAETPYLIYTSDTGQLRALHYENKSSLAKKYDLVLEEGLMGVGIWALGYDGDHPELWDLLGEKFK